MRGRKRVSVLAAFAGAAGLAYSATVLAHYQPQWMWWVHQLVPVFVPAVAAAITAHAALRMESGRRTWLLIAAGCATWAAGDLLYTILDAIGSTPAGKLTYADSGYLALVPLWGAALILHPARGRRGLEQLGTMLDAGAVVLGVGSLAWAYVVAPLASQANNMSGVVVNLAYPIGDIALLTAFFALMARVGSRRMRAELILGGGALLFALSDLTFTRLALTNSYKIGSFVDLMYEGAFILMASAAVFAARAETEVEKARPSGPLVGVVGIVSIAILGAVGLRTNHRVVLGGAMLVGLLVAIRQTLLLNDRRRLIAELAAAVDVARRASAAKTEFVSHMSHEIGTPLTAIMGYASLIEGSTGDAEIIANARIVQEAGSHLRDIVREAADIAQVEQGRLGLSLEPVSISHTVADCVAVVRPTAVARGVKIEERGREDIYVLADNQRLKQVLMNLLSNAVKYNRERGDVVCTWRRTADGRVIVDVMDKGPGIPPEARDRLFMPFERLGSGGGHVSGTGLGLAVSKRLVEAMGGHIGVESEVGQGSTFWIELEGSESPAAPPIVLEPAKAADRTETKTILYIEDNPLNITLVQQLLRGRDVTIVPAPSAELGVEAAAELKPDMILLDSHLPDGSAVSVLGRLRAEVGDTPVVILSADSEDAAAPLLSAGARAYLSKPIDVEKLLSLLDDVLSDAGATQARPA
jgi:signal transduction histidine kinase/CheY-like chemotaxis protein